jgi:hypothetical protein
MKAFPATRLVSNRLCRSRPATARSHSATWVTDGISGAPAPDVDDSAHMTEECC